MNYISIKGGNKSKQDKIISMVEFCIEKLMPRMNCLNIDIKLTSIKGDAEGYCLRETDRDFEIEVDSSLTLRKMLETVAHEMVHVKQYAKNELRERYQGGHHQMWKGRKYINSDYLKQPWEKEAYKMQEILLQRLKNE